MVALTITFIYLCFLFFTFVFYRFIIITVYLLNVTSLMRLCKVFLIVFFFSRVCVCLFCLIFAYIEVIIPPNRYIFLIYESPMRLNNATILNMVVRILMKILGLNFYDIVSLSILGEKTLRFVVIKKVTLL